MKNLFWATTVIGCSVIISIGVSGIKIDKSVGINMLGAKNCSLSGLSVTRVKEADWKVPDTAIVFGNEEVR